MYVCVMNHNKSC